MNGQRRTAACHGVHLLRVRELLFKRYGCAGLDELTESCAGVRKPPAWQLDVEFSEFLEDAIDLGTRNCHGF